MINLKLKAYSLLEISISIMIIGILMTSAFKGFDLLNKVKLNACVTNIKILKLTINELDSNIMKNSSEDDIWQMIYDTSILKQDIRKSGVGFTINLKKESNKINIILNGIKEKDSKYMQTQFPEILIREKEAIIEIELL